MDGVNGVHGGLALQPADGDLNLGPETVKGAPARDLNTAL